MTTTRGILKLLAAITWYTGGIVLLIKGTNLLLEAHALQPGSPWIWLALAAGLLTGMVKAVCLFTHTCAANLARINNLHEPRLWQFYRPRFFIFLALMITLGAFLAKVSHEHFIRLLWVAGLDLSISIALLGSSFVFWQKKAHKTVKAL